MIDRHNRVMPTTVRPELPPEVERAIDGLGNRVRVATLRSLRVDGPATGAELATRIGVNKSNLHKHLVALEELGLITPNPPRTEPGRIRRSYSLSDSTVQDLIAALTAAVTADH